MPNANRSLGIYLRTGDPDTMNESSLFRPGELGCAFDYNDRAYQIVKLDSGATASNSVGVVAANQLAFWKDKSAYLVTNDWRQAIGGAIGTNAWMNQVAGIFRTAATAGYYCCILQRGRTIAVADDTSPAVGETAIASSTANTSRIAGEAVGTAPTYQPLGIVVVASSASVSYVDVDIPNIP